MPYRSRDLALWRVYTTLDEARVLLDVVAADEDDAQTRVRLDHWRQATMIYSPIAAIQLRVDWAKIGALELGRVELIRWLTGPKAPEPTG